MRQPPLYTAIAILVIGLALSGCQDTPPSEGPVAEEAAQRPDANTDATDDTAAGIPSELKTIFAALPEDTPPPLIETLKTWPPSQDKPAAAAELAGALTVAAQLAFANEEGAGFDAFRLAGVAAEAAVTDVGASGYPPQQFAGVFYNQARALARAGQSDEAIDALRRSVQFGLTNWEAALEDDELASLHEDPDFKQFIEEARVAQRKQLQEAARETLAAGETFPLEFTYTTLDGNERSLSDYTGKVVIVDFWGTWCPPCREEIPTFNALQDKFGDEGLQILGLNYRDTQESLDKFLATNELSYPTGIGPEEARDMVPGFRGYPTTVFVGRDGRVRATLVGGRPLAFLEEIVTRLLAEDVSDRPDA